MQSRVYTVAFQGMEVKTVSVQVQMSSGLPAFSIVGLADKSVAESRERVRAALNSLGVGLPPKRITVNLAPADLPRRAPTERVKFLYSAPLAISPSVREMWNADWLSF